MNKFYNDKNYKNPLLDIMSFVSEHFDKNQDNQIEGTVSECVLCGKGIKATSKNYSVVAGSGSPQLLIHKDEWNYSFSKENTDNGFMGSWEIGTECFKKIKHLTNVKDYLIKKEGK